MNSEPIIMLRKKSAFSLIEIIITFILASILFGCIFTNFSQTMKLQSQIEGAHRRALQRESLQLHLQSLLSQLPLSEGGSKSLGESEKEKSPLYIAEFPGERTKALWFNLTIDYSDDRRFMGPLTYCLYHDEKNHALQLLTRNQHGDEKVEKILCDVKGWKLSLFDPKKKVWAATWPRNMSHPPLCLKLLIFERGEEKKKGGIEFAFTLPAASQAVVYP